MQTIIVTVNQRENRTAFQIDGKIIATISKDLFNKGRYCGSFGVFGSCNNVSYPAAVEFVSKRIENHFAGFGLGAQFNRV